MYEAYEKAEYDYKWALKTRRKSQETNKEIIAELDKAKSFTQGGEEGHRHVRSGRRAHYSRAIVPAREQRTR